MISRIHLSGNADYIIFKSKFWKKFKVNNHHSGVTYGCTGKHWTVEKKNFKVYPVI